MLKNILLFETWGEKFWEIGPKPNESKHNQDKETRYYNLGSTGIKTVPITDIDEVEKGDRIYHVNGGLGTIVNFEKDDRKSFKTAIIKFDQSPDTQIFLLKVLVDQNMIEKVIEEENDGSDIDNSIEPSTQETKPVKKIEEEEVEEEEIEEEESEEGDDEYVDVLDDLSQEELMIMKINEFFNEQELSFLVTLKEVRNYRKKLKKIQGQTTNPIKDKINERRLETTFIIEKYFQHLIKKFPNLKIYRFIGQIPYEELWDIRTKDRITISSEDTDKHGQDNGVIFYWVFSDAVVFKTL